MKINTVTACFSVRVGLVAYPNVKNVNVHKHIMIFIIKQNGSETKNSRCCDKKAYS